MPTEQYPEHAKLRAIQSEERTISAFTRWLEEEEFYICRREPDVNHTDYWPTTTPTRQLIADYFKIDLSLLEEERMDMLEKIAQKAKELIPNKE